MLSIYCYNLPIPGSPAIYLSATGKLCRAVAGRLNRQRIVADHTDVKLYKSLALTILNKIKRN